MIGRSIYSVKIVMDVQEIIQVNKKRIKGMADICLLYVKVWFQAPFAPSILLNLTCREQILKDIDKTQGDKIVQLQTLQ